MEIFRRERGLPPQGGRFSFAADAWGKLWIAGGDLLGCYEKGKLTWLPEWGGASNLLVAQARSGGVWISSSSGLIKLENDRRTTVQTAAEWHALGQFSIQQLYEDRRGTLWIGTHRKGLYSLTAKGLTAFPISDGAITAIMQDREGNVWAAMNGGGIVRLRPKPFAMLDEAQGMTDSVSTSVCEDASGGPTSLITTY